MRRTRTVPREALRQAVDRLAVERLLSERTVLRVALDFIEEKGLAPGSLDCIRRRSR